MMAAESVDRVDVALAAPALAGLDEDDLAALTAGAVELTFARDERIVVAGARHRHLHIVVDGVAEAVRPDGRSRWLLAPDSFGEAGFLHGSPEAETVTATCPTTVIRLDRSTIDARDGSRRSDVPVRVGLLAAQHLASGMSLALIAIAGSAIFLERFGAALLPVVYLAVAGAGAVLGIALQWMQRRVRLATLVVANASTVTGLLVGSWLLLAGGSGTWVSFGLLVLFRLELQAGLVLVGGQAGRLLDVQQLKLWHPRIGGGLAAGFLLGGAITVPLVAGLGRPAHLLAVAAGAVAVQGALGAATCRRYRRELDRAGITDRHQTRPESRGDGGGQGSFRSLLRQRYIALLFAFHVLSATGSQVIDYMLYERAAARFGSEADLASFLGGYTAVLNIVDIGFLVAVAGALLTRYGIRYGLLANSTAVTALLVIAAVVASVGGLGSGPFFLLIASVRIVDIALNDGATLSSLNAAYQPLPSSQRLRAQIVVEGIGGPLAVGATGVVLLVVNALPLPPIAVLMGLAVAVGSTWTVVGALTHRQYRTSLVARLHDTPDPPGRGFDATGQLITSDDASVVARGLDRLEARADPAYGLHLLEMTAGRHPAVRALAIGRLGEMQVTTAERIVAKALDDHSPEVRAAAIGARHRAGRLAPSELARWLADPDPPVAAVAAAAALDHLTGDLTDRALDVLAAALTDRTGSAERRVVEVLAAEGDLMVSFLERALIATADLGPRLSPGRFEAIESLAATARYRDPDRAASALLPLVPSAHPLLGTAVLRGLLTAGYRANGDRSGAISSVLVAELDFGRAVIEALVALGPSLGDAHQPPSCRHLVEALLNELEHVAERTWTVLAVLHGREAMEGSRAKLRHADGAEVALATEAMGLLLDAGVRRHVTAVVGDLPLEQRARLVAASPPGESAAVVTTVRAMVGNARVVDGCRLLALAERAVAELGATGGHRVSGLRREQPSRPVSPGAAERRRRPSPPRTSGRRRC